MAETLKILGQGTSVTNTWQTLYTVPGSTSAVVSSLALCNVSNDPHTLSVGVILSGAGAISQPTVNGQYLIYQQILQPGETMIMTMGITLATGDHLTYVSDGATVSFMAFGTEIT